MEISYQHKFIFVHVWKNAGTSVRDAIRPYAYRVSTPRKVRYHFCKMLHLNPGKKLDVAYKASHHMKAFEIRELIGRETFDNFYSFAFSRNPYSRLVSHYTSISLRESHGHHKIAKDLGSFEEYAKWRINSDKETFQWQFVTDLENKTIVDFIGKFESLQEDLSHIGGHLNIDLGLNHHNKTMRSEKKQISEYFTKDLIDFVKINYKKDFEFFGYDIDKIP